MTDFFENHAEEYESWFREYDRLFQSELDAIRPLIPRVGKGVEIGAGTGIFAFALGISQAVEPSEAMARIASQKGIDMIKAYAENLPIADESYDYALMVTVDCFLTDVRKALDEVYRILTPSGIFIIAFLDRATELGLVYEKNKHLHPSYAGAHFHSAAELSHMLHEAGFLITKKSQTIYTLDNIYQPAKEGVGEGVFGVIKAEK